MSSSSRLSWMVFVFLAMALTIHGQSEDDSSEPQIDGPTPDNSKPVSTTKTTNGIFGAIYPYFHPITSLLYQIIDSILRNVFQKKLPCTIYDFTRMGFKCEDL